MKLSAASRAVKVAVVVERKVVSLVVRSRSIS